MSNGNSSGNSNGTSNGNVIQFPSASALAAGFSGTSPGNAAIGPDDGPFTWTRGQVWQIRFHKRFTEEQKKRILHNFITNQENGKTARGAFLRTADNRAYLFDARRCKLYRIDPNDLQFRGYMFDVYGINSSEEVYRHVTAAMQNGTIAQGMLRDVRRFSYWDRETEKLYISRYDGTCYELDGDEVLIRDNGYGPAVFLDDDGGTNCDSGPNSGPTVGNHHELFKHLIDDLQYAPTTVGGMTPSAQRTCLGIWIFALAFPDLLPTKPIMLVEGQAGSGKTLALQRIAYVLHGKHLPMTIPKKEDPDFEIKILRSPIAIIDDVNTPVDWLRDRLCTYATGGVWSRRKLYSDDSELLIKPQAFLGITTNNPSTFRQGQVADRCLIIRLERRANKDGFTPSNELLNRLRFWRPELQGEWLYWLNEIVRELKQPQPAVPSKYRMADFAHLAHVIAKVLNQPAGPPGDWSPEAVDEMLEAMQNERESLVAEGDTLADIVDHWMNTSSNHGREIKTSDLFKELSDVSKSINQPFFCKSPKKLESRLRETSVTLAHHFDITRKEGTGGVTYTFRRT